MVALRSWDHSCDAAPKEWRQWDLFFTGFRQGLSEINANLAITSSLAA